MATAPSKLMSASEVLRTMFDFQRTGDRRDALRFLGMTFLGLGLLLLAVAVGWLFVYLDLFEGKGIAAIIILVLSGGVALLVGVIGLLVMTARYRMYKSFTVAVAVLLGLGGAVYAWKALGAAEQERRQRVRSAHEAEGVVQSYVAIPGLQEANEASAYIRGKLVLVHDEDTDFAGRRSPLGFAVPVREEMGKHAKLPEFFFELPRELQAASPDEVETIIWLKTIKTVIGEYPKTKRDPPLAAMMDFPDYAYRYRKTVTVIDRTHLAAVGVKVFAGTDPLPGPAPDKEQTYLRLNREVVDYLKSLPRK